MKPAPLLLAALLAAPASAGWRDISAKDFELDPPPAEGTAAYKADFEELLRLQASRTPRQCALATAQKSPSLASFFGGSGLLDEAEIEKAAPLFAQIYQKVAQVSQAFKRKYGRRRPYDADSRVKPCAPKPGGATSYPSAHAMAGEVFACALSAMRPERAERLAERGRLAGELRVIAGVHHPSDVAASRRLAAEMCGKLLADPEFVEELAAAK